jgi:hypothetical protein
MILLVVVVSGACDPEPIVPRPEDGKPVVARPGPQVDAGRDAAMPRPKLPPPDAGGGGASADAGADAPVARAPRAGDIAIVEVLVNPTGQDVGREWIEIANLAIEPLDLAALHVADAAVEAAAPAGIVAPGGRVVIGQAADGGAAVAAVYGTRLMLNNGGEELALCLGPCADGVVLDRVSWDDLGAGYDGHALVLDRSAGSNCPAQQPFGLAGDFGTPGQPDAGCGQPDGGF